MNPVIECMKNHRSIRQYETRDISDELLNSVLEASRWASTSSNFQAYSVITIRNKETKDKLAELCGNQKHILDAPVFLVFVADLSKLNMAMAIEKTDSKSPFEYIESFIVSTVDTALVGQNVLLASESLGLGGVFIGGLRNNSSEVSELLNLPDHTFPLFGMCLGYPKMDKIPEQKPRLPIQAYVHSEKYEQGQLGKYIEQYDDIMQKYYATRTDSNRNENWSDYVRRLYTQKSREHIRSFLEGKGFGLS